jgi:hypothetical protein
MRIDSELKAQQYAELRTTSRIRTSSERDERDSLHIAFVSNLPFAFRLASN